MFLKRKMGRKKKIKNMMGLRVQGEKKHVEMLLEVFQTRLMEIYTRHPDKKEFSRIGRAVKTDSYNTGTAYVYADVEVLIELVNKKE